MSEHQLFCYAEKLGDADSMQQKSYRVFNKVVGVDRYNVILQLVKSIIPNNLKLDDFWKSLKEEQIQQLSEIPEFNSEIFTKITRRVVEKPAPKTDEPSFTLATSEALLECFEKKRPVMLSNRSGEFYPELRGRVGYIADIIYGNFKPISATVQFDALEKRSFVLHWLVLAPDNL